MTRRDFARGRSDAIETGDAFVIWRTCLEALVRSKS